jgi:hypothetical protein
MPRDASGNYTLPPLNPVVGGTIIDVNWANPTLADIASQLNNVYTRDGLLGPLGQFKVIDGTVAAPSLTFNSEPILGIFRESAGSLAVAAGGEVIARFSTLGVQFIKAPLVPKVLFENGTALLPSVAFFSEPNTGMFKSAAGVIGWSILGVERMVLGAAGIGAQGLSISGAASLGSLAVGGAATVGGALGVTGSITAAGLVVPSLLADPNATINNLFIGNPIASALFQRSGANAMNIRIGDSSGSTFVNYGFSTIEMTAPVTIRSPKFLGSGGTYNPLADPNAVAFHGFGVNGGGLTMDQGGGIGFLSFYIQSNSARLRVFGSGNDYIHQFNSDGSQYSKLQYGYTDVTHYAYIGWDGANTSLQMVHNANTGRITEDSGGNMVFNVNGTNRGFFAVASGFYLMYSGSSWEVKKTESGVVTTGGGGLGVVTFAIPFVAAAIVCVAESSAGGQYLCQIVNKSTTGFTVRVVDLPGSLQPGIVVNWIAKERSQ